ncbi:hypothetical protein [Mycobacterium sp. 852002-50816_SCH5313054-b]|uniref:hypothetical protein n=1 Tax=Mycobacterium sp. 852002-50816_SCH5313054-b TaxID=1834092 RepID=UPI0012EAB205|nr:hypothetical protein [Mycobacterium sp. 852002-50816_SCH5313054-b]
MTGAIGVDTGMAAATGKAPPVDASGAPEAAGACAPEAWSTAADSTPEAPIVGADNGGATGAWGGADDDEAALASPSDKL